MFLTTLPYLHSYCTALFTVGVVLEALSLDRLYRGCPSVHAKGNFWDIRGTLHTAHVSD